MNKRENVFTDSIRLETQTVYNTNGNINIYPCSFEENHYLVVHGDSAKQKGCMVTRDDGTSHFYPYAVDSGSRYRILFRSAYGEVKETRRQIIFVLRFPKYLGKKAVVKLLSAEQPLHLAFLKSVRSLAGRKSLVVRNK